MKKARIVKKRSKITTIEGLARAIAEGFADQREEMSERFNKVERELVRVRGDIAEVNRKLDKFDARISALEFKIFGFNNSQRI